MNTVVIPPVPDDAEALFEEARQRARRRRQRIATRIVALLSIGVALAALVVDVTRDRPTTTTTDARPASLSASRDLLFIRALPRSDGHAPRGEELVRLDPGSGDLRGVPIQLACGDTPHCLIAAGRHLVVSNGERTLAYAPSASTRARPTVIGKGWITLPAQVPNAVWLGILARPQNRYTARLSAVREVTLDGRVLRSIRPPDGQWPVEAVRDGLLYQRGDHLRLWSFATRRFTIRLPGAIPADAAGNTVASCADPCQTVAITNVRSGSAARIAPPTGYRWTGGYDGRFSPDATMIALPVTNAAPPWKANALALVDLASGAAHVIPGSHAVEPDYRAIAWSTTGRRIFFAARAGTVRAYAPGAPRSTTIARLPGDARAMQIVAVARHE